MRRDWLQFPAKKRLPISLAQTPTSTLTFSDSQTTCHRRSAFSLLSPANEYACTPDEVLFKLPRGQGAMLVVGPLFAMHKTAPRLSLRA
jgi:hypothetical protein